MAELSKTDREMAALWGCLTDDERSRALGFLKRMRTDRAIPSAKGQDDHVRYLSKFTISENDELRISEIELRGQRHLQVRRFRRGVTCGGWFPFKGLVNVPWDSIEAFASVVMIARKRARKGGKI